MFVSLGLLELLLALTSLFITPAENTLQVITSAVISTGFLIMGYALYKGLKSGWVVSLCLAFLDAVVNIYYGTYHLLVIDATLILTLLLVAKHYTVLGRPVVKSPVPPPSAPLAIAIVPKEERKFVRRKH